MGNIKNNLPLSIGILAWKSDSALENTLNSYKNNGLLNISDDIRIIFQEVRTKDIELANKFNLKYIGLSDNIGIGKAFSLLATSLKYSSVLLLEHDWELIENYETTYKRLLDSILLLKDNGVDCVRLRHRKDYGDPLYSRSFYENNELNFFDNTTQLYSPHLLDCVHWRENPHLDFPDKIKKISDYFLCFSRWANWTNNPCVYKKDFYLNCIKKFVGEGIELEEKISKWWAENHFTVAQGEGLFKHNDLDKSNSNIYVKDYNIVDIFPYFNEKELLELRIKMLNNYVDKFIICEANRTHTGLFKEFSCKKILSDLGLLSDKIQVLEVDLSKYENKENTWIRERMQRNAAKEFIKDNDICLVCDCDEIINPKLINYYILIAKNNPNNILRIPMVFLNCRADLRVYDKNNNPEQWDNAFICLKHHIDQYTLSEIRESKSLGLNNIKYSDIIILEDEKPLNSGWHFAWMGDNNRRLIKYKSFMHYYDSTDPELIISPDVLEGLKPLEPDERRKIINDWISFMSPLSQKETEDFIMSYCPKEGTATDTLGRKNILKNYPLNFLPQEIFENKNIKEFLLPEENL